MALSLQPGSSSQNDRSFALKRRRTIIACSACRKRKIRCITTEQPPKNPCARCVKRHINCEYVAPAEPEYYSTAAGNPDYPMADAHNSGSESGPPVPTTWTTPITPPDFPRGSAGSPLGYPSDSSRSSSRNSLPCPDDSMLQSLFPPYSQGPRRGSYERIDTPHPSHPYMHPPHHSTRPSPSPPIQNPYEIQAAHARQYLVNRAARSASTQPSFMQQPTMSATGQPLDPCADLYSQFLRDTSEFDWARDPGSGDPSDFSYQLSNPSPYN